MYKFFLLLVLTALLVACKKEVQPSEPIHFKLDPVGLKYTQLALGKYFIYKDSATGNTDSLVVTRSSLYDKEGLFQMKAALYENYELIMTQKSAANDSIWIYGLSTAGNSPCGNTAMLLYGALELYFVYPASCPQNPRSSMLPSLTIEGETYKDVVVVDNMQGDLGSKYFWAPSVGLIKFQLGIPWIWGVESHTYSLVRHN